MLFRLRAPFQPRGDQPQAIKKLTEGLRAGFQRQTLLGVTGSGKTFTMASVIEQAQRPTLIISPNKTLAAQLYQEFQSFFPENSVRYFVSFYDYYQPEAYLPHSRAYIQKDARVNAEIDRLRHAAIQSVLSRPDTIIVASVSCIYGIGDPENYKNIRLELRLGQTVSGPDIARHLTALQYLRDDVHPLIGQFSISAGRIFIHLVTDEQVTIRMEKRKIKSMELTTGQKPTASCQNFAVYPARLWVTPQRQRTLALHNIKSELEQRVEELQSANTFEEAERLEQRTMFDLAMMKKHGYVNGIENYSRHLSFRQPGQPPLTLLDYFPRPFLLFVDESHITVPQLRAMQESDRRRKQTLIDYGFRLPSALDNRPLTFAEFEHQIGQTIFVSATPGPHELTAARRRGSRIVQQVVRPTGIIDPRVRIRPAASQVQNLLKEIIARAAGGERVLALTLTRRSAEDLTEFLLARGVRAAYLHAQIKTLRRPEILNDLRRGKLDVVVGINLLREGLDLPEVSLVAILDADREGFLRNARGLIQMAGRAARSLNGEVILYADSRTGSMKTMIAETNRRRAIQLRHNRRSAIIPFAVQRPIAAAISADTA